MIIKQMNSIGKDLNKSFYLLPGEKIIKKALLINCYVALTNYRLYFISTGSNDSSENVNNKTSHIGIPLNLILKIELLEFKCLRFSIKLGNSYILFFENSEICNEWLKVITESSLNMKSEDLFAYVYYETLKSKFSSSNMLKLNKELDDLIIWEKEFKRMNFNEKWKITHVNKDFNVCDSYPRYHIVPQSIDNEDIMKMSHFRGNKRFPSVVWRSQSTGAVIIRCAQPHVGLMCWRNESDERFVEEVQKCTKLESDVKTKINRKLVIIDARHYTTAHFNRIRGGGTEFSEYYGDADILFMQLENIHSVRSSFDYVSMFSMNADNWLSSLEASYWLRYVSKLLRSAGDVARTLHDESRSVIIHCSDGWDRTPQLTSLTQLLLDDYYRTIEGFQVLIEKEWIQFGHKFSDRCRIGRSFDSMERSPVFIQWLDCVHQLLKQNPTQFEFNETFLIKLAIHTYSGLFGEFLSNTEEERIRTNCRQSTVSIWSFLNSNNDNFINPLYFRSLSPFNTSAPSNTILSANYHTKYLVPWNKLFFECLNNAECQKNFSLGFVARNQNLTTFQNNSIEDVHEELGTNTNITDSKEDDLLMAPNLNYNKLTGVRKSKSACNLTTVGNSDSLSYDASVSKHERSNNSGIGSRPNILLESSSRISSSPAASSRGACLKMNGVGDLKYSGSCRLVSESSQFINHQNSAVQPYSQCQQLSVQNLTIHTDSKSLPNNTHSDTVTTTSSSIINASINGHSESLGTSNPSSPITTTIANNNTTTNSRINPQLLVHNNCNSSARSITTNSSPYCNYQSTELFAVSTPNSNDFNNFNSGMTELKESDFTDDLEVATSTNWPPNNLDVSGGSLSYFQVHQFDDPLDDTRISSPSMSHQSFPSRNVSGGSADAMVVTAALPSSCPCDVDGVFSNPEPINVLATHWRHILHKQKSRITSLENTLNVNGCPRDHSEYYQLRPKFSKTGKPLNQTRADSGSSFGGRLHNEDSISSHDSYVMLDTAQDNNIHKSQMNNCLYDKSCRHSKLQNMPDGLSLENLQSCTKEYSTKSPVGYFSSNSTTNGHEKASA